MNATFLLFEDGSYYSVFCTPYPMPKGTSKPVDAYILTEPVGDFTIAAQKAVHAVFAATLKQSITIEPVNAGFDLEERIRHDADIAGQSGGLSFALAFARVVLNLNLGNIAATGVVRANGQISPVQGIRKKLTTATKILGKNDLLFLPKENLKEIPKTVIDQIQARQITLVPVSHMDEVLAFISHEKKEPVNPRFKRLILLVILLMASMALAVQTYISNKNKSYEVPQKPTHIAVPPRPQTIPKNQEAPTQQTTKQQKDQQTSQEPAAPALKQKSKEKQPAQITKPKPAKVTQPKVPAKKTAPSLPPPGPEGDHGFE